MLILTTQWARPQCFSSNAQKTTVSEEVGPLVVIVGVVGVAAVGAIMGLGKKMGIGDPQRRQQIADSNARNAAAVWKAAEGAIKAAEAAEREAAAKARIFAAETEYFNAKAKLAVMKFAATAVRWTAGTAGGVVLVKHSRDCKHKEHIAQIDAERKAVRGRNWLVGLAVVSVGVCGTVVGCHAANIKAQLAKSKTEVLTLNEQCGAKDQHAAALKEQCRRREWALALCILGLVLAVYFVCKSRHMLAHCPVLTRENTALMRALPSGSNPSIGTSRGSFLMLHDAARHSSISADTTEAAHPAIIYGQDQGASASEHDIDVGATAAASSSSQNHLNHLRHHRRRLAEWLQSAPKTDSSVGTGS